MAAKDKFHDAVKHGLIKDGWTITDDPLTLKIEGINISIDLGAEKLLAAEKEGYKIAVEIKSFLSHSPLTDFHAALGQFLNYRLFLSEENLVANFFLPFRLKLTKISFKKKLFRNHSKFML